MKDLIRKFIATTFLFFVAVSGQTFGQSKDYIEWYLRTPDTLDVYNQDIYIRELGKGKDTVVVIHGGFGANHDYMLDAIRGLEKKYHFVLYDQRGSLLSPAPKEKLTFQKNVGDLDLLIKQLGAKKTKIMAHSMGTLVAMEYLKQHPDKVSNLVLIGAIPPKSDSMASVFSKRQEEQIVYLSKRPEVKSLPIYKKYKELKGQFTSDREKTDFNRMAFAASNIYKIDRYKLMRGGFHFYKEDASVMVETVDWKYDYRGFLDANGKTTIIMGDYDFLDFNGELHQQLIKDYKGINFRLVKSAGHNIWIDQPEIFKRELDVALRKN
ncbi:alpha/beta fold hydrolase [Elizabethkingia anophelis]|uniref:alpha/beta fold hydrolase n=2 Tax=Elizabethkingia anophelis TaxID=1117645 RepID=UPI000442B04C|nr:alpha/beta hydrolase [Elizabethkingia anophelis]CDN74034.1 putative Proline iminopeptidase [Elizabethkingia anophelis]CDN77343.1 putative Proline iminopeptidase [Elizabethkingia anophelis]